MSYLIIRVDASTNIGFGHLNRCMVLASILEPSYSPFFFVSKETVPFLKKFPYPYQVLDNALEMDGILPDFSNPINMGIIDGYHFDLRDELVLKKYVEQLCVIDDLKNRTHLCDFLLNQNPGFSREDYEVPEHCICLLGTHFCLIDSKVVEMRSRTKLRSTVKTILINFGAFDSYRLTQYCLQELLLTDFSGHVHIALGHSIAEADFLAPLLTGAKFSYTFYGYTELAPLLFETDLVFGAAGSSSWERCCLGIPAILITVSPDQIPVAQALDQKEACFYLGHYDRVEEGDLSRTLNHLLSARNLLAILSKNASVLCDGLGTKRVADVLQKKRFVY